MSRNKRPLSRGSRRSPSADDRWRPSNSNRSSGWSEKGSRSDYDRHDRRSDRNDRRGGGGYDRRNNRRDDHDHRGKDRRRSPPPKRVKREAMKFPSPKPPPPKPPKHIPTTTSSLPLPKPEPISTSTTKKDEPKPDAFKLDKTQTNQANRFMNPARMRGRGGAPASTGRSRRHDPRSNDRSRDKDADKAKTEPDPGPQYVQLDNKKHEPPAWLTFDKNQNDDQGKGGRKGRRRNRWKRGRGKGGGGGWGNNGPTKKERKSTFFDCEVCNREQISFGNASAHVTGRKHIQALRRLNPSELYKHCTQNEIYNAAGPIPDIYCCDPCQMAVWDKRRTKENHLNSWSHKQQVKRHEKSIGDGAFCPLCKCVIDKYGVAQHIQERQHQQKFRTHQQGLLYARQKLRTLENIDEKLSNFHEIENEEEAEAWIADTLNGMDDRFDGGDYEEGGYDEEGYDEEGYDEKGYDEEGYDEKGYDKKGYEEKGDFA